MKIQRTTNNQYFIALEKNESLKDSLKEFMNETGIESASICVIRDDYALPIDCSIELKNNELKFSSSNLVSNDLINRNAEITLTVEKYREIVSSKILQITK